MARECGYLTAIDVSALCDAARTHPRANAIVVLRSIGEYVSVGEELLEVHLDSGGLDERAAELLLQALKFDHQRDLDSDAGYGIEQLTTIGWTSTSTAKSNPQPGMLACWNLRDLIGIWYGPLAVGVERCDTGFPVVYPDSVPTDLLRAFESLAIVASESMQHQTIASVYGSLTFALRYVPPEHVALVADISRRSLSALGEHVLTRPLEDALYGLADALEGRGQLLSQVKCELPALSWRRASADFVREHRGRRDEWRLGECRGWQPPMSRQKSNAPLFARAPCYCSVFPGVARWSMNCTKTNTGRWPTYGSNCAAFSSSANARREKKV
ncbi:hypothetical protein GCM10011515_09080 [Tsuneonella deserti]|uniref:Uncharacterized protein n=1 Tax=Tsuneonella deserti TaxID=2035528 RepID=A0ABQ1S6W5_9SPHN|nr:DUF2254 family protein [Tsuneonella deserti]GGD91585.1 hypothetical protein GCM10011515_09080 [Tsuneonella deserti]